jgi:hypothetical protein
MINKMKNLKPKVESILRQNMRCRDSDSILYATLLYYEMGDERLHSMSGYELLKVISEDVYPSYDTIARVRRKLQNEDESLRGKNYNERHHLEAEVRTNISSL